MKKSDAELDRFKDYLLEKGKRETTIKDYIRHMTNFEKWLRFEGSSLKQLTRYDVQQYIKHLQDKGNKATTIHPKFSSIIAYSQYCQKSHLVENVQHPGIRHTRHISPKSLSRNERNRIFRELERSGNLRSIAIAYFLLYTGLRVSELVALNHDDVQMGERFGSVLIRDGKGGIVRTVPLPSESRYHLRRYLENRTDNHPALFLSNFKQRISIRTIQRIFKPLNVHPHMLRHTYGRELVSAGIDIATVAELMGHSDVNITRRYAAPSIRDLEESVEKVFG
ncbi:MULTISPECIES: tyrosine-type recombinase/integrase [Bacillus]|uniref:tyrosine-type recombinase/integrase n=1 Tax=Bacillus TaxID=1386 RepID=UPI001AA026B5|nr:MULTISPECIES: tyrosine-type recombinase/integrase [Bacillus]MBO1582910.1 tyrosine-type recombinase/integrase [Bacillus sp. XF8]MBY0599182.1 tyrosine-type recombinase/integrase [Bacillus bingmayongensis]MCI0768000.1 tyrosine-type recombinase/integrase [Bacillus sp. TL12]